jgi:hypothetical protein
MKISIPTTKPGSITKIPSALPPIAAGRAIITPTPEQLAQLANGENYWTPGETPGEGVLSAPPIPVPVEVPMWKVEAITKLTPAGEATLYDAIGGALEGLDEPLKTIAKAAWFKGNTIARNSPTIASLKSELSLTDEQLDNLFRAANALTV